MNVLKAALNYYWSNVTINDPEEAAALLNMIDEANELDRRMEIENQIWPNEIRFICISSSCDIGNELLYDTYGKLARENGNEEVPIEIFTPAARKRFGAEHLTDWVIRDAWEVITGLWADNERDGNHNADGTMKHSQLY